ncbi:MAG: AMP-binding protein [Rhodospirillales bacterium]
MGGNLFEWLAALWQYRPQRSVLEIPGGRIWPWADLDALSSRIAAVLLAEGLAAGDRVSVQVPKSPEAVALYLACLRAGLVYHPLNPDYTPAEVAYLLADAEPAAVVCAPEAEVVLRVTAGRAQLWTLDAAGGGSLTAAAAAATPAPLPAARADDDLAVLLDSSGTTGRPKGVMLSHRNLAANAAALLQEWGFTQDDVLLHGLPLFHAHGLFVALHCALASGARIRLLPRFDAAAVVRALPGCTVFMGVPTHYSRLLAQPDFGAQSCLGVRLFVSGSAPLLPETFAAFRARTGHILLERYGMTETGMNTSNPLHGERLAGSVGAALPGVGVRIVDRANGEPLPAGNPGEVQVRGANVFRSYWRAPEKTAEAFTADGWFRTGDLGVLDSEGRLALVGRASDLIISGGLNVYPREVELCLDGCEGVGESAVVGAPDADFGEIVVAFVEPCAGCAPPDPERVIAHARVHLAGYKAPKRVVPVDDLPRNAMGKVQKALLRRQLTPADDPPRPGIS